MGPDHKSEVRSDAASDWGNSDSAARRYIKAIESGDERLRPMGLVGLATITLQESIGMPQIERAKALERAAQLYTQALSEEQALGRGSSALTKFAIEGLSIATSDKDRSHSEEEAQITELALFFQQAEFLFRS